MMYMPDALNACVQLMEADPARLVHRNAFNITSMSFTPEILAAEIRKHMPDFEMTYRIDPVKEGIARSWPTRWTMPAPAASGTGPLRGTSLR